MVIEALFNLISGFINLIPFELPDLPQGFQEVLDLIFNGILGSLSLINVFIDLKFWLSVVSVCVLIKNIKHLWNMFIWLLNLIPVVNVTYWS